MSTSMVEVPREGATVTVEKGADGRIFACMDDLIFRPWPNPENILAALGEALPDLKVTREQAVLIGKRLGQAENRDAERITRGSGAYMPAGPFLINRYAPLYRPAHEASSS